jgi:hypothetical protein
MRRYLENLTMVACGAIMLSASLMYDWMRRYWRHQGH